MSVSTVNQSICSIINQLNTLKHDQLSFGKNVSIKLCLSERINILLRFTINDLISMCSSYC